jgi:DNA-directed RNA polymerase subunit RPC12/RpoP
MLCMMPIRPKPLPTYRCLRCGHEWYPRKPEVPARCPGCGSAIWQRTQSLPLNPRSRRKVTA